MALNYIGELNLGAITPLSVAAGASLTASLSADVTALLALSVNLGLTPPSITLSIAALVELIASFNIAITASLPTIDFQASACAVAIASLTASLADPLAFQVSLGGAGIFLYAYDGITSGFGPSMTGALGRQWPDGTANNAASNAIILGTVSGAAWDDMRVFFGAVPDALSTGVTYLGGFNIGTLCPLCVTASFSVIADLEARLQGLVALALSLSITPPSIAGSLSIAVALKAALTAALHVQLPGVSFQIAAILKVVAKLNADLALLATLALSLGGSAAVFAYTYSGTGAALGPALTASLATGWPDGSIGHANALVLGTVTPAVWATMSFFFGGL